VKSTTTPASIEKLKAPEKVPTSMAAPMEGIEQTHTTPSSNPEADPRATTNAAP
jgi:hypothetical protein